jgi:hypothetical protein
MKAQTPVKTDPAADPMRRIEDAVSLARRSVAVLVTHFIDRADTAPRDDDVAMWAAIGLEELARSVMHQLKAIEDAAWQMKRGGAQ